MGNVLQTPDETDLRARLERLSLEQKVRLLVGSSFWTLHSVPAAGLMPMTVSDGPSGVRGTAWDERDTSLLFPNPSALAATWDPDVLYQAGALMGAQARDKGVHVLLAPTVNLHRSPLGGRHFECYSEDPLLTAELARGFVTGTQSAGVGVTVKHYIGNESETERMSYDALIREPLLREVYLPPFESAVQEAGAWAVMAAYNKVNGATMTGNRRLLTDLLKEELAFDGVVVSDWFATNSTVDSANAGLDLVMPGPDSRWSADLLAAVRAGQVPERTVDDKVLRLLRLAARTGALEGYERSPEVSTPDDARNRLRGLASTGAVLLSNDGTLPLKPNELSRVALVGPAATRFVTQGGGSAHVNPATTISPIDALRTALGDNVELDVAQGAFPHRLLDALPTELCHEAETGRQGIWVEFRDNAGKRLFGEHRDSSQLVYMGEDDIPSGATEVVLRTRLTARTSGTHELAVSGVGEFTLTVAGTAQRFTLTPESTDLGAALLRPAEQRFPTTLTANEPVDVEVSHLLGSGMPLVSVGVGYREPHPDADAEMVAAVESASSADVAVVMVGNDADVESESYDRDTLALAGRQDELVYRVAGANSRTVVVVNAGAPVLLPWRDEVAAVLWAWLPGQEGAAALAEVLTGAAEPGGRLPTTFPASEADCPVLSTAPADGTLDYGDPELFGYRGYAQRGTTPAFPFGHGIGYTTWTYESATVDDDGSGGVTVDVTVRNTGQRQGREVVQCYLAAAADAPDVAPPRLVGFVTVTAWPGQRVAARLPIRARTLSRYDPDAERWKKLSGQYRLLIGRSATAHRLQRDVILGQRV